MLKNLKIDIIYYNTPSDFEFEFNLGGYCRCRILNAKCATLKETINKLALAVTRSTVVIIVGKLLGENGFVAPVAKSIGKNLAPVDHRKFHITNPEPISLIEGSLPLVTSSGDFGGCIIESGPQSIVMLTDEKQLRDKISSELLSFYLTSLSRMPEEDIEILNKENTVKEEVIEEPEVIEQPVIEEEIVETKAEEPAEVIIDKPEVETPEETTNQETEEEIESPFIDIASHEEDSVDIFSGAEKEDEIFLIDATEEKDNSSYFEDSDDSDLIFDNDFEETDTEEETYRPAKKNSTLSTVLLILVIVLLLAVGALLYFLVYLPGLDGINTLDYIKEVFALESVGSLLWLKV